MYQDRTYCSKENSFYRTLINQLLVVSLIIFITKEVKNESIILLINKC